MTVQILHHLRCMKPLWNPTNNGIDYQPQLVFSPDFWTINQYVSYIFCCVAKSCWTLSSSLSLKWRLQKTEFTSPEQVFACKTRHSRFLEKFPKFMGIARVPPRINQGVFPEIHLEDLLWWIQNLLKGPHGSIRSVPVIAVNAVLFGALITRWAPTIVVDGVMGPLEMSSNGLING